MLLDPVAIVPTDTAVCPVPESVANVGIKELLDSLWAGWTIEEASFVLSASVPPGADGADAAEGIWVEAEKAPGVSEDNSPMLGKWLVRVFLVGFVVSDGTKEEEDGDDWPVCSVLSWTVVGRKVPRLTLPASVPGTGLRSETNVGPSVAGGLSDTDVEVATGEVPGTPVVSGKVAATVAWLLGPCEGSVN